MKFWTRRAKKLTGYYQVQLILKNVASPKMTQNACHILEVKRSDKNESKEPACSHNTFIFIGFSIVIAFYKESIMPAFTIFCRGISTNNTINKLKYPLK